jgi:DNA-binding response OmpR family regulator
MFDAEGQSPPRVLVAEPRAELRMQIGHALRQAGMDADFATNGEEAQMKAQNGHYDVAILNPDMESHGSHSLCRKLSRGTGRVPVPVITLCDRDSSMRRIRSLISGAQACLVRPLSSEDFVSTVWQMARGD